MGSFGSFFEFGISVEPVPCKSNRIQQFRMNNSLSHNSGTGGLLDRYQYGYDRACNRLFRNNLVNSAMSELYGYDNLNQLTDFARGVLSDANSDGMLDSVASPSRTQTWSLDSLGNWSTFTTNSTSQSRTHNAQNQVTGVGSTSLTYDANGSMTADESGRIFVYDAWNRLAAVRNTANSPIVGYSYDALGRRIIEDRPNANTVDHLYYSTAWQVLEERRDGTSSGDVRRQYLWSLDYVDALTARVDYASGAVSATYHAQYDANWNITAIADASSGILERYIYDPYGTATVLYANWTVRGGSPYGWNYLHQGGRLDVDSNLYHFRHRDYSATLGRWTQTDPIGFEAGDLNLYRYVGNSPVNALDPDGKFELPPLGGYKQPIRPVMPKPGISPLPPRSRISDLTDLFVAPSKSDILNGIPVIWPPNMINLPHSGVTTVNGQTCNVIPKVTKGGHFGPSGCLTCSGVLLIPTKPGYPYIGIHFGPLDSVGRAIPATLGPNFIAYINGGGVPGQAGPAELNNLAEIISCLKDNGIPIKGYVPWTGVFVDDSGRIVVFPDAQSQRGEFHPDFTPNKQ